MDITNLLTFSVKEYLYTAAKTIVKQIIHVIIHHPFPPVRNMGLSICALNLKSLLSPRWNESSLSSTISTTSKPPCHWVELPESSFGIQYEMPRPVTTRLASNRSEASTKSVFSFSNERITKRSKVKQITRTTPFDVMMTALNHVTSRFPNDTAIVYIREILEPGDPEYGFLGTAPVRTSILSQKQVQRIRLLIVPQRREEILVAYLDHYKILHATNALVHRKFSSQVVQHFCGFQKRYSSSTSVEERFDLLFGFSFAIHKYSAWMYEYERKRSREKLLSALARHWRHLLMKHSPEELGLDAEFSYPAVFSFLDRFKQQIESIDMKDLPGLRFVFETVKSQRSWTKDESRDSFHSDAISVSTMTTCTTLGII